MARSYRNVNAGSNSESYESPHDRGFAKKKKRHTHGQLRTHNKNSDETTFQPLNCTFETMNHHWASGYQGKLGNIPNDKSTTLEKTLSDGNIKWTPEDRTIIDTIDRMIETNEKHEIRNKNYLVATKKQIERRGKAGLFTGHSHEKDLH